MLYTVHYIHAKGLPWIRTGPGNLTQEMQRMVSLTSKVPAHSLYCPPPSIWPTALRGLVIGSNKEAVGVLTCRQDLGD